MSRVLTIAGNRWLAGMSWRSYDQAPARGVIKNESKALSADAYVQRVGTLKTLTGVEPRYDVGYAKLGKALKKGQLFSLGASLAESRPGPWIGVFSLDENLFYYLAVDVNGAIIPDQYGDRVCTKDELNEAREAHKPLADAALIEGDLKTLENLLQGTAGSFEKVRPVSGTVQLNPMQLVPVIVFIALGVGGYYLYQYHEIELKRQQEAARLAAILAAKKLPPPISPMAKAMPVGEWLPLCNPARWHLPYVEDGWTLKQYECISNAVALTWTRDAGASTVVRPPGTLTADGNVVTQLISLGVTFTPVPGVNPPVAKFSQERAELQAWANQAGLSAQLGQVSNVPGFALKQAQVVIESPLVPWSLYSLGSVTGLRLNSFNSTSNGEWILKGVLYGS